jgi:hypothetical protein
MPDDYEELTGGSWHDYGVALKANDFESAWRILVHLSLTANTTDKEIVETAAFSALDANDPRLVRGALEALSILMRFKYRVDRRRYEAAKARIRPAVLQEELVQDQLADLEMWWAESEKR